jgi:hypothetical protein
MGCVTWHQPKFISLWRRSIFCALVMTARCSTCELTSTDTHQLQRHSSREYQRSRLPRLYIYDHRDRRSLRASHCATARPQPSLWLACPKRDAERRENVMVRRIPPTASRRTDRVCRHITFSLHPLPVRYAATAIQTAFCRATFEQALFWVLNEHKTDGVTRTTRLITVVWKIRQQMGLSLILALFSKFNVSQRHPIHYSVPPSHLNAI